MDIFIQKIKIKTFSQYGATSCCPLLSLAVRASPFSVALATLSGAAQPILADSLPRANISVLLEPGGLGVGSRDSSALWRQSSGLLTAFSGALSSHQLPLAHLVGPSSQYSRWLYVCVCVCTRGLLPGWPPRARPQRCLPHPRSNTTVWFGRGHSAVQTTVCCWGGSRTAVGSAIKTRLRVRRWRRCQWQTWPPKHWRRISSSHSSAGDREGRALGDEFNVISLEHSSALGILRKVAEEMG